VVRDIGVSSWVEIMGASLYWNVEVGVGYPRDMVRILRVETWKNFEAATLEIGGGRREAPSATERIERLVVETLDSARQVMIRPCTRASSA
jgi:hypothetical protein